MLHAALDLTPYGVLAVEEVGIVEADEELAVRAVGNLRARHRTCAANMRFGVELRFQIGLVAAAHAGAGWIAALRHEAIDHAVEHHAVIEAFRSQLGDALDMARRKVGTQLDDDIAA